MLFLWAWLFGIASSIFATGVIRGYEQGRGKRRGHGIFDDFFLDDFEGLWVARILISLIWPLTLAFLVLYGGFHLPIKLGHWLGARTLEKQLK